MKRIQLQNTSKFLVTIFFTGLSALLSGQSNKDGSMPQYLYGEFSKSEILMKNQQLHNQEINYNTLTGKMVFTRDGKYYDISNPEMIDTVYLNESKFVPVGKAFYEVLMSVPVALFVQYTGSLQPAGKPVGYGGTSQVASSDYLSSVNLSSGIWNLAIPADYLVKSSAVYWILKGTELVSFENEKQFIKLFPEKSEKLKSYIKENKLKLDKQEHLIKLVKYCGSL
jgi:hypothetical protein